MSTDVNEPGAASALDGPGTAPAAETTALRNGARPAPSGGDHAGADGPSGRPSLTGRRRARLGALAVLLVLLGGAAGFGVGGVLPTQHVARADVIYLLTREQPTGFLREDRNLTTQLVLLTSRTVLEPVARQSGVPVDELADSVTAAVVESSEIIRVELRHADPSRTVPLLDAVVAQYLAVSNNDERARLRDYLDGQLRDILARQDEVRAGGVGRQDELPPLVVREQSLRGQLDELRLSTLAGPAARVLVAPYADPDAATPQPVRTAAAGALTALVIAALAVAVVARRSSGR